MVYTGGGAHGRGIPPVYTSTRAHSVRLQHLTPTGGPTGPFRSARGTVELSFRGLGCPSNETTLGPPPSHDTTTPEVRVLRDPPTPGRVVSLNGRASRPRDSPLYPGSSREGP